LDFWTKTPLLVLLIDWGAPKMVCPLPWKANLHFENLSQKTAFTFGHGLRKKMKLKNSIQFSFHSILFLSK